MPTIKHILFPFDFSAAGTAAIPYVRALADQFHARVTILSVVPPAWISTARIDFSAGQFGPDGIQKACRSSWTSSRSTAWNRRPHG